MPLLAALGVMKRSRAPKRESTLSAMRMGQWDPRNQRPELWNIFNSRIDKGESIRIFPLSNWTELDIWLYIHRKHSHRPALFSKEREVAGARRIRL